MSSKYRLLACLFALVVFTTSAEADLRRPNNELLSDIVRRDRIRKLSGTNPENVHQQPAMAVPPQLLGTQEKLSSQPANIRHYPSLPSSYQNKQDLQSSVAPTIKFRRAAERGIRPVDPQEIHQLSCPGYDPCVLRCPVDPNERCKLAC